MYASVKYVGSLEEKEEEREKKKNEVIPKTGVCVCVYLWNMVRLIHTILVLTVIR